MDACRGGRMNNTTTNKSTNRITIMTTNTTTNTELGQEQPYPQLAERVVGEVRGVHYQNIAEQALR
jgi:hypothetical protein